MSGDYPNNFYRVSTKAFIRNEKGEVLVVKEGEPYWNLPGGGIDHDEKMHDALTREMYEEALIQQPFTATLRAAESFWFEPTRTWLLWLVYDIKFKGKLKFAVGADAEEVMFVNPEVFKDSKQIEEQLIYKLSTTDRQV